MKHKRLVLPDPAALLAGAKAPSENEIRRKERRLPEGTLPGGAVTTPSGSENIL